MKIDPLAIYTYDDLTSSFSVMSRVTTHLTTTVGES